jgi:hypothetical protein
LGQQQQFLDLRVHGQKPEIDWEELDREMEEIEKEALAARKRQREEFYKTHERGGRGRPHRKTEN